MALVWRSLPAVLMTKQLAINDTPRISSSRMSLACLSEARSTMRRARLSASALSAVGGGGGTVPRDDGDEGSSVLGGVSSCKVSR